MLQLSELCRRLAPKRTVLLFGAGSSMPSGGPTSAALASALSVKLTGAEGISDDLQETASLLVEKYGRKPVVEFVRLQLRPLTPVGGLLAIPELPWSAIYTTNFDMLIEKAFARCNKPCIPVRSNLEYERLEESGTPLFKIHGCISLDSDSRGGHLVLTESDYDSYATYREVLFKRLSLDLLTKTVVVIGHSLRDRHLKAEIMEALRLHQQAGAPGEIFVLVFERDEDRALLLEKRGIRVAFGSLDEFTDALSGRVAEVRDTNGNAGSEELLPLALRTAAREVHELATQAPNASKLFNGSAATYADVRTGLTFERSLETTIQSAFKNGVPVVSIVGVAGIGKTTMARRIALSMAGQGTSCWEQSPHFPIRVDDWLTVDRSLRASNRPALLVVDEATVHQARVNSLVSALTAREKVGLQLRVVRAATRYRG